MRFHIAGLGSIGTLLGFHLRRALDPKHTVHLIHKNGRQAQIARFREGGVLSVDYHGVRLTASGFEHESWDPATEVMRRKHRPASPATEKQQSVGSSGGAKDNNIDSLFVATKSHSAYHVIEGLLPRLSRHCTIVLVMNGMGIYEDLATKIFRNPNLRPHFILASNTHGAWTKGNGHIVHAGTGALQFGIVPDPRGRDFEAAMHPGDVLSPPHARQFSLDDIAPQDSQSMEYVSLRNTVHALLAMQDLHTEWLPMSEVQLALWRKLVVNSVINPLTALLNCRNGEIFKREEGVRILRTVCSEAAAVFSAEFRSQPRGFEIPEDKAPTGNPVPPSLRADSLMQHCLNVAEGTAMNHSSMLSDVRIGKPTEIDFINGYLVRMGKKYKIHMPATTMLLNLIKMRSAVPPSPL